LTIPKSTLHLMTKVYKDVLPATYRELNNWKRLAKEIPNEELRTQALASINSKTFHCEGGAVYALLAKEKFHRSITFIVAYQTISDYLDNLCDRSTSLDPVDFKALHEAMIDAITPYKDITNINYYRHREDQADGGYLHELIKTCQSVIQEIDEFDQIAQTIHEFATHYSNLQIHKHVKWEERVPRLKNWFNEYKQQYPSITWNEFSASSGSTLGIFCLISYGLANDKVEVTKIKEVYFPWVQALHILLDYFIDQEEDRNGGDLNFCFYYKNGEELKRRITFIASKAKNRTMELPDGKFHRMVVTGLLGLYLADEKVRKQKKVFKLAKTFMKTGGKASFFFYYNVLGFRKWKKLKEA
jgi:tetraprenyl-beta-curcumene synthase